MTPQDIFDRVSEHLLKQGRAAINPTPHTPSMTCVYRAPNGDKCAVGCLIPDELYRPDFEGLPGHRRAIMGAAGVARTELNATLIRHLQSAHDTTLKDYGLKWWAGDMREIAVRFDLTPSQALRDAAS